VCRRQGDQIGKIFDFWDIVHFGQFFENLRSSLKVFGYFFHDNSYAYILTTNGLGCILGAFSQTQLVTLAGAEGQQRVAISFTGWTGGR
jgi:hypothetical protein